MCVLGEWGTLDWLFSARGILGRVLLDVVGLKSVTCASGLSHCLPSSMYQTKAVIIAMIITAVVSISVTIFCFQTKVRVEGPSLATLLPFLVHSWPLKVALEQAWEGPEDFP